MGGWGIIAADVIVMANLAQIAGSYGFRLFGLDGLADSTLLDDGRRRRLDRRDDLHLLPRHRGLGADAVRAARRRGRRPGRVRRRTRWSRSTPGTAPDGVAAPLAVLAVARPGSSWSSLTEAVLLAVFIYWGWDTAVAVNEETDDPATTPGRAAIISTRAAARHLRPRLGRHGRLRRRRHDGASGWATRTTPTTSSTRIGPAVFGDGVVGRVFEALLMHLGAHLGLGVHPDDDPADRPHLAVDGRLQGAPRRVRPDPPAVPDARPVRRSGWARSRSPSTSA